MIVLEFRIIYHSNWPLAIFWLVGQGKVSKWVMGFRSQVCEKMGAENSIILV